MDTITDGLTEATNDLAEFYDILQAQDLFQLPEGIAEDTELAQTGARILEIQVQKERAILRAEEMEKKIKQLRMIIKELRELRELKDDQSSNDGSAQTEIQRLMMEMQALVSEVHEMILRASLDETKNESVPEYFQDITEFTKAANKSGIRRSSTDSQGRSVSDPGSYTAQELVSASVSEDGQMFGTEPNIDVETPPKSVMSFVTTTRATFRLLSDRVRSSLWKLGIPLVQTPSIPPTAQSGLKSFEDVFRWYQGLESQQSRKLKGGHLVRTVVSSIIVAGLCVEQFGTVSLSPRRALPMIPYTVVWMITLRVMAEAIMEMTAALPIVRPPPVPAGKRRAAWSCHCGNQSFDDFIELREGAVAEYESSLRQRYTAAEGHRVQRITSVVSAPFRQFARFLMLRSSQDRQSAEQFQPTSGQFQATPLQLATPIAPQPDCLFLLLCLPYHNRGTRLVQLDLRDIQDDKGFFYLLRNNYREMRGKFKRILSLRTVKSIEFVQFELRRSQLVNIRKENDLPPEALREDYMYNPMPADMIPPLGENYMMHLSSHPDHADPRAKEDLDRIPKKLKDRLAICPAQGKGIGWGVHFVEGWHLSALSLVAYIVFLIASLIFLVCWVVLKQDVQGASGVAAYILALTTLSVGTLQAVFELELL